MTHRLRGLRGLRGLRALRLLPDLRPLALSLAALAATLAGCATPRPEPRAVERPAPALTASQNVAPAFPVPSACERMVFLARQEWALFGSPEVAAPGDPLASRDASAAYFVIFQGNFFFFSANNFFLPALNGSG